MQNIPYFKIIKESWLLTWKYKFFWVLGFFMLLGSAGSNLQLNNPSSQQQTSQFEERLAVFFQNNTTFALVMLFLGIAFLVFLVLLRITAKASIIKTLSNLEFYAKQPLKILLRQGFAKLGQLFLLELFLTLAFVCILIVLALPIIFLFSLKAYIFAVLISLAALAIFLPTLLLIYFINKYAYCYSILGDIKLFPAMESAYFLFLAKTKESLLMSIFSLMLTLLLGFTFLLFLLITGLTLILLGILPYLFWGSIVITICLVIGFVFLFPTLLFLLSLFTAFKEIVWVRFFQEIAATKIDSAEEKEMQELKEQTHAEAMGFSQETDD